MQKEEAIKLAQEAESRRIEIEQLRNIPDDLMLKAKQIGLVKMWSARKYGGSQARVSETMRLLESMAYYNGSIAWVVAVTNCSSLLTGYLPAVSAGKLHADDLAMVGGFAGPAGRAKKVEEGIIISGDWSWGSGISHCSHILGGAMLYEEDKIKGSILAFFEPNQIKMKDNWYVNGLKGTNSIDYSCRDLLISDDNWTYFPLSKPIINEPLYQFSSLGALSLSVSVISLGLARRAVDEIKILVQNKKSLGQDKALSKSPVIQSQMGKVLGSFQAAHSLFYNTITTAEKEASQGLCTLETKAAIRLAACHAAQLSINVVSHAHRLAGGSGIWESSKLEELHRDIHVVSQHGMISESNYRIFGSAALGNRAPEFLL